MSSREQEASPERSSDSNLPLHLDRQAILRTDLAWIEAAMWDRGSRFLVLDGQAVLFESSDAVQPRFLTGSELGDLAVEPTEAIFLGVSQGVPLFAFDLAVAGADSGIRDHLATFGTFISMRTLAPSILRSTWEMIAQARSLCRWNQTHRFCPTCGAPMVSRDAGYVRGCSSNDCPTVEFPRIDPAVIVRILFEDRCLLARQSKFAPGLRSIIAGFVEPGETLEKAVAREVQEEVGLAVHEITYVDSQPWPFPRALMVGFTAQAVSPKIRIDRHEIEAADWYARERVRREMSAGILRLPSTRSIARRLIDEWLAANA